MMIEKVNPYEQKNVEDGVNYWFGTDDLGRDLWTRTWSGARVSLIYSVLAAMYDLLIGVTYGGCFCILWWKSRYVHAAFI